VEVSVAGGRRVSLGWRTFAAMTLTGREGGVPASVTDALRRLGVPDPPGEPDTARLADAWRLAGWREALDSYLRSRDASFYDRGEGFQDRRVQAVGSFLAGDGPPPPLRGASASALALPVPLPLPPVPLGRVLHQEPADTPLDAATLGSILSHGLSRGTRHRRLDPTVDRLRYLRSFGSAFSYLVTCTDVAGVPAGCHLYDPAGHCLQPLGTAPYAPDGFQARAVVFIVAEFAAYQWRYRHERALRHLYFDAGRTGHYLGVAARAFARAEAFIGGIDRRKSGQGLGLAQLAEEVLAGVLLR
jgi:hypothetical protein